MRATRTSCNGSSPRPDRTGPSWCTDITEHPTRAVKVYCCAALDVLPARLWAGRSPTTYARTSSSMLCPWRPGGDVPSGTIVHADRAVKTDSTGCRNSLVVEVLRVQAGLADPQLLGDPGHRVAGSSSQVDRPAMKLRRMWRRHLCTPFLQRTSLQIRCPGYRGRLHPAPTSQLEPE